MIDAYHHLLKHYSQIHLLESIQGLLYWDLNTYMPSDGLQFRTEQFKWLQQNIHKHWIDEEFASLISKCEKVDYLDSIQKRNVELTRREYDKRTVIPIKLVGDLAAQSNKTLEVWKIAKAKNSFQYVVFDLEKLFSLNLKRAELLAESSGISDPYEALINFRDPGFSVNLLNNIFNEIKTFLVPFVKKCISSQPDQTFLTRRVSREIQQELVKELTKFLEYPHTTGRVDEVEHPLTIGCGPKDVRITVKYQEDRVMKALSAGIHEIGHGLDSLQRNPEWRGQPINARKFPSFGESQSRLLENIIGLSREFWSHFYPIFKEKVGVFTDIDLDTFYSAINTVKPGLSRMRADELTYILHIIIRFEIERDLFAGNIKINELPQIWNEKYDEYLNVEVPSDTLGVMQDLHWYSQYWGYFFGYALGDIISSQIAETLSQLLPEWRESLQNGSFTMIREWLANNVHSLGAQYDSLELVEKITGEPLTNKYLINYLNEKYTELYKL
ncbi:MAG: carboxypeptidase M32 [Candidatus Heimdallarchaeota archaeon]|nr:MAG: carboxypeptidase M32 [Candidatus Heimdallarchaeota archaeon]